MKEIAGAIKLLLWPLPALFTVVTESGEAFVLGLCGAVLGFVIAFVTSGRLEVAIATLVYLTGCAQTGAAMLDGKSTQARRVVVFLTSGFLLAILVRHLVS
jgi:hypothetical protein